MNHLYKDVPHLGTVVLSRHAQARAEEFGITDVQVKQTLFHPGVTDTPDGLDVLWRELAGIRLVILLRPKPNRGARLVKTLMRVQPQARIKA